MEQRRAVFPRMDRTFVRGLRFKSAQKGALRNFCSRYFPVFFLLTLRFVAKWYFTLQCKVWRHWYENACGEIERVKNDATTSDALKKALGDLQKELKKKGMAKEVPINTSARDLFLDRVFFSVTKICTKQVNTHTEVIPYKNCAVHLDDDEFHDPDGSDVM